MTTFDTESLPPILTVRMNAMFAWEQARPGGCRCACALFHASKMAMACTSPAEPGLLIRVETPTETSAPLPVCLGCYHQLVPRAV
ncbi:DUF6372 family protein [Streptomyces sp. NRRL S-15]|uniref:DUF6372 family protein n=1 Tax=Streptomyces sp. NRRL S-15 TaxID=1463886 RepID=UPI0004CB68A4|nr:DUF6372 family protein [Streptomyces sp. NRRL S-15]